MRPNVVSWDEWIVLLMAALYTGALLVADPLAGVFLLIPLTVRSYALTRRPWFLNQT